VRQISNARLRALNLSNVPRDNLSPLAVRAPLAAKNKCLARMSKSPHGSNATKQRGGKMHPRGTVVGTYNRYRFSAANRLDISWSCSLKIG
jgi:hypothetical protein